MSIRNRIIDHVTVRAGDLVPHPLNFRKHPERQREALKASYDEVGFARSVLGYKLPDGRIQLIDGHLRTESRFFAGAVAFFHKPINNDDLLASIRLAIGDPEPSPQSAPGAAS